MGEWKSDKTLLDRKIERMKSAQNQSENKKRIRMKREPVSSESEKNSEDERRAPSDSIDWRKANVGTVHGDRKHLSCEAEECHSYEPERKAIAEQPEVTADPRGAMEQSSVELVQVETHKLRQKLRGLELNRWAPQETADSEALKSVWLAESRIKAMREIEACRVENEVECKQGVDGTLVRKRFEEQETSTVPEACKIRDDKRS